MITFNRDKSYKTISVLSVRSMELLECTSGHEQRLVAEFNVPRPNQKTKDNKASVSLDIGTLVTSITLNDALDDTYVFDMDTEQHKNDINCFIRSALDNEVDMRITYTHQVHAKYEYDGDSGGLFSYVRPEDYEQVREEFNQHVERINDNCDNYRIFPESMSAEYDKVSDHGCCGSFDKELTCKSGNVYLIGFNYGH